jgi:hypothetical protein
MLFDLTETLKKVFAQDSKYPFQRLTLAQIKVEAVTGSKVAPTDPEKSLLDYRESRIANGETLPAEEQAEYLRLRCKLKGDCKEGWLSWSQYPKKVINGETFAVVGQRYYSQEAIEAIVPSGLGGQGLTPTVIADVLLEGNSVAIGGLKRFDKDNIFIVTDNNSNIIKHIRVNTVRSINDLKADPGKIFGNRHTDLDKLLKDDGWQAGAYQGTSDAIIYYKQSSSGRSEIVFNYGGGRHSGGGQTFSKPYYYKLEGPEFNKKTKVIDPVTYPDLQNAINFEKFRLIDGTTGKIIKE